MGRVNKIAFASLAAEARFVLAETQKPRRGLRQGRMVERSVPYNKLARQSIRIANLSLENGVENLVSSHSLSPVYHGVAIPFDTIHFVLSRRLPVDCSDDPETGARDNSANDDKI